MKIILAINKDFKYYNEIKNIIVSQNKDFVEIDDGPGDLKIWESAYKIWSSAPDSLIITGGKNGNEPTHFFNKHKKIVAFTGPSIKEVDYTRRNFNGNVLSLSLSILSKQEIIDIVETFITTPYEGTYQRIIDQVSNF